ncbi:FtsQ-type POTRA domain-containing protein [bacterium]|nr:FtsQ-type POTRA domain-containing protein [bacterium]
MAKKTVSLQDAEKLSARRAWRKKLEHGFRWGGAAVLFTSVGFGIYAMQGDVWNRWTNGVSNWFHEKQASASHVAGLNITHVYLEGRERMPLDAADKLVGVKLGDPLLATDIDDIRSRLETSPWVQKAEVQRSLSGALHVRITERQPVAIWQHDGEHYLVDRSGTLIVPVAQAPKNDPLLESLPLLIGATAPQHWQNLLTLMAQTPEIFAKIHSAVWVGERRWDLVLFDGTRIMLPQANVEAAWNALRDLNKQGVLEKSIAGLDLRDPDRLYVRLKPGSEGMDESGAQPAAVKMPDAAPVKKDGFDT